MALQDKVKQHLVAMRGTTVTMLLNSGDMVQWDDPATSVAIGGAYHLVDKSAWTPSLPAQARTSSLRFEPTAGELYILGTFQSGATTATLQRKRPRADRSGSAGFSFQIWVGSASLATMNIVTALIGALCGASLQLNMLAARPDESILGKELITRALIGAVIGAIVILGLQVATRRFLAKQLRSDHESARFVALDPWTSLVFLWPMAGMWGIAVDNGHLIPIIILYSLVKGAVFIGSQEPARRSRFFLSREWLASLFMLSGFAALIYQIAWQRVLFSVYGVNIESVTIVVAIFMFGLGIGALAGGYIAKRFQDRLPRLFLACELAIGAFGIVSLPLIKAVGTATSGGSLLATSIAVAGLLLVPTTVMGATLPILVSYLVQTRKHVGRSVGFLYFVNTLGSALAAFVTVNFFLTIVGLQAVVVIAAAFNILTGTLVFGFMRKSGAEA